MYGHRIEQSSKDQPGKVANPARGHLDRETYFSLSPFAPENFVSREVFGRSVANSQLTFTPGSIHVWSHI